MERHSPTSDSQPVTNAIWDRRQFLTAGAGLIAAPMLMVNAEARGRWSPVAGL